MKLNQNLYRSASLGVLGFFMFALSIGPSTAFGFGDHPPRMNRYTATPIPPKAIETLREYAKQGELDYKFPFNYKNAFLLSDTSYDAASVVEVCWVANSTTNTLTIETKAFPNKGFLAAPLTTYNPDTYLKQLTEKIHFGQELKFQNTNDINPICAEMESIVWPKNIF